MDKLPEEVLKWIASCDVQGKDLKSLARVSKRWQRAAESVLWASVCVNYMTQIDIDVGLPIPQR